MIRINLKLLSFVSHNLKNLINCNDVYQIENKTLKKIEIKKN